MPRLKNIDVFALLNILIVALCGILVYDGMKGMMEFFVYSVVASAVIAAIWLTFRRFEFHTSVLVLVELGIAVHYLGTIVRWDEGRLYDAYIFGLRYDMYVHSLNAFAVALLSWEMFLFRGLKVNFFHSLVLLLTVMGLGAFVEGIEYAVHSTVQHNGVGGYDNNMQDLIANMLGALAAVTLVYGYANRSDAAAIFRRIVGIRSVETAGETP